MDGSTTSARIDAARIAARVPPRQPGGGPGREAIAAAVAAIAERFRPERVVLFGSRASGRPRPDSDVDLLVVMETPLPHARQADLIQAAVSLGGEARLHPTVRTPEQVRIGLAEGDFFIEDAVVRGATLYQAEGQEGGERSVAEGSDGVDERNSESTGLKRATERWLAKAERDCQAVAWLLSAPQPFLDVACFNAQQCAEKYLKALLQERGIRFGRIHDLHKLVGSTIETLPPLADLMDDLNWLSTFGVAVRYPDLSASAADAERALRIAAEVRRLVRDALGLPVDR